METKICITCKKEKPLDQFTRNKTRKGGYHSSCKQCHKEYNKQHYLNNISAYKERAKKRNKDKNNAYLAFKKSCCCLKCGENKHYIIDFHHTCDKDKNINMMKDYSDTKLRKELEKCVPLCSNCHKTLHHLNRTNKTEYDEFIKDIDINKHIFLKTLNIFFKEEI